MKIQYKRAIFLGDDENIIGSVVNKVFSKQKETKHDIYEHFKRDRELSVCTVDVLLKACGQVVLLADTSGHRRFTEHVLTGMIKIDIAVLVLLEQPYCSVLDQYNKWIKYILLMRVPTILVVGKISVLTIFEDSNQLIQISNFCPRITKLEVNLVDLSLETVDSLKKSIVSCAYTPSACPSLAKQSLLLSVQEVFHLSGNRDVVAGRVISGTLKEGMTVYFAPGSHSAPNIIFEIRRHCMTEALPGDYMGFSISDKLHNKVKEGFMVTQSQTDYAVTKILTASIYLYRAVQPLTCPDRVLVRSSICAFEAEVTGIQYKVHKRRLSHTDHASNHSTLRGGEHAVVSLQPLKPVVLLSYLQSSAMGKVEYLKNDELVGRGLIMAIDG